MRIRPAREADVEKVAKLFLRAGVPAPGQPWTSQLGAGATFDDSALFVCADDSDDAKGAVWADRGDDQVRQRGLRGWSLNAVGVSLSHEGRGIGRGLVQHACAVASRAGVEYIWGTCPAERLAGWYRMQGFSVLDPGQPLTVESVTFEIAPHMSGFVKSL